MPEGVWEGEHRGGLGKTTAVTIREARTGAAPFALTSEWGASWLHVLTSPECGAPALRESGVGRARV